MIQVGDRVCWTSQSQGVEKTKQGTVIAIIPAGMQIERVIPEELRRAPKSRKKWSTSVTRFERAVVEVQWPHKKRADYYTPRLSALKRVEG